MSRALVAPGNVKSSGVDKLRESAAQASQVRTLSTHPDVIALRVESIRTQVDRCMWAGIVLGLAFTMVNVQAFAAQDAALWSLAWFAAWLLDPMVSLVLIAVLRAEQITARYQVEDSTKWLSRTKRFAFAATYVMNTWASFGHRDLAGIVLHSVPPLLVFCAAETAPVLRDRLTEAVMRAERAAAEANPTALPLTEPTAPEPTSVLESHQPTAEPATEPATGTTPAAPARKRPARKAPARPAGKRGGKTTGKEKARAHWDAEIAAGREPTGGELARVAEVDPSLGRRWARDWKTETPDIPGSHAVAADITPAATTDTPGTTGTNEIEGEAA
ncbi:hypothetical protein EV644_10385 [Kribbella orskensis]|uniref:DUF2637 domain-containing protein n=1 Tax=Kribbella orskensis TaxID=2512216 RepID=A0ABY2BQ14_9ACTN|nr:MULTISPECIES: hypothetical protein [Kribbella]TCN39829.1 hypothetical protein EV642_106335 [Kribbella sp. VKM Ac-2500]TCO27388.1 hypothetical protein EV644_10385 [Kribbella orskensis]